jgi:dipeptidyl aminopeptidase/acylaminoacyl peptidase
MTTLTTSRTRAAAPGGGKAPKAGAKRPVAPQDLLRIAFVADPRISPDGRHVVFVRKGVGEQNEYQGNLWIVSRAGAAGWGAPRQFTSGSKDAHPRWSPAGDRIAFLSERVKGHPQIYTIPAAGGEATPLTKLPEGSIGGFRWSPDGALLAASFRELDPDWTKDAKKKREEGGQSDPPRVLDHHWYRMDGDGYFNGQRYHLYVVDAATGEHRDVYARDTLGFFSFDFSPHSRELVITTNPDRRAAFKPWNDEMLVLDVQSGKSRKVANLPRGPKDSARWSPDGRLVAYAGRVGPDGTYSTENLELWVCDPKTGDARSLTAKTDYCLMAPPMADTSEIAFAPVMEWSPDGRRVWFQLGWHGECHVASVPAAGGPVTVHTEGEISCRLGNLAGDGRSAAVVVGSPVKLDEIHLAELGSAKARLTALSDLNGPLLDELELAAPECHWVETPDRTKVQTWVLRPPGFKRGTKYPALLNIHGGPHAQYGVGFFHEFQVLAAAGYVVVYSNPRGSKGYGRDHCHAIRGSWGEADWVDVQAVTAFIRSQPWADAKRLGVMGGSYGGFMTNWAIGHTNDFAVAITDRCVSNLVSMFGSSDFLEPPDLYWPGNSWDRPEAMWEHSPIKYLGNAKTPTLIIHSEGDLRCNIEQAEQVFAVLSHLNVPARFVRYPRSASHGLSRGGPPDLRLHRLQQMLDWLAKHLKA